MGFHFQGYVQGFSNPAWIVLSNWIFWHSLIWRNFFRFDQFPFLWQDHHFFIIINHCWAKKLKFMNLNAHAGNRFWILFNLLSDPKNFVKSMSVKKFSYLGQIILGLRRSARKRNPFDTNMILCRHSFWKGKNSHIPRACYKMESWRHDRYYLKIWI